MLRFLKYIFLIFGGLALAIMTFFFIQNKEDLAVAYEYKNLLSYDGIEKVCSKRNFDCFEKEFETYASQVSLTGLSLGLKLAFNYLEESKEKSENKDKNIEYALYHLRVNNLVIKYGKNRFHGFKTTYGGYIGKMRDFLEKAQEFSDNLIKGLREGKDGISSLKDDKIRGQYTNQLDAIELDYKEHSSSLKSFVDKEVARLKKLYDVD